MAGSPEWNLAEEVAKGILLDEAIVRMTRMSAEEVLARHQRRLSSLEKRIAELPPGTISTARNMWERRRALQDGLVQYYRKPQLQRIA
ncbi:MAG TPA: hypothetical protein VEW42_06005 [Candidatus Eisenbacteria bacterium]|nr:hypothetical protein [Candidatus Eisenbacteria bacterium]